MAPTVGSLVEANKLLLDYTARGLEAQVITVREKGGVQLSAVFFLEHKDAMLERILTETKGMPSDVNEHHRDQHDNNDVDHVHDHADILQSRGADSKQQVRVFS